jgi:hypothetical protein
MQKLSSLVTLGTAAGPSLRPHRAQSSNLLIVNGTYYVIDAGDGVAWRGIANARSRSTSRARPGPKSLAGLPLNLGE